MILTVRKLVGAIIFDLPRYVFYLYVSRFTGEPEWIKVRNRNENLIISSNPVGVACDWKWTSDLYLPSVFPSFGKLLFRRAFDDYPIKYSVYSPARGCSQAPQVSFVIGHRGIERLPLLLKTLDSISGQEGCKVECIVVEQDHKSVIEESLPDWVQYVFSEVAKNQPYSRSSAFNRGAIDAKSEYLIFHDNDLVVPSSYAKEVFDLSQRGFEFINIKRFIFYLSKSSTNSLIEDHVNPRKLVFDSIMQNAEGGGSIGANKISFNQIGRFDERFVGWGGEDNEFWERALTKNTWTHSFMPLIHLWHQAQPEKNDAEQAPTKVLYEHLTSICPEKRIEQLLKEQ